MSEGWAEFVDEVLARPSRVTPLEPVGGLEHRDPAVPKTKDIEYNIRGLLWDLYDISGRTQLPGPLPSSVSARDDDDARSVASALSFEELFAVFSPAREAVLAGPIIRDIDEYLQRLEALYPDRAAVVRSVRGLHLA